MCLGRCWDGKIDFTQRDGCFVSNVSHEDGIQKFFRISTSFVCVSLLGGISPTPKFFSGSGCGRRLTRLGEDWIFLDIFQTVKQLTLLTEWLVPLDIVGPN